MSITQVNDAECLQYCIVMWWRCDSVKSLNIVPIKIKYENILGTLFLISGWPAFEEIKLLKQNWFGIFNVTRYRDFKGKTENEHQLS